MCVEMCADMNMCICACVDVCVDKCAGMCIDTHNMCTDECVYISRQNSLNSSTFT